MTDGKISVPDGEEAPASQIGATLEALAATIADRRDAGEESYTHRLLAGSPDKVLKKVMEEAGEVALAAKDVEAWATSSIAAAVAFESARAAESAAAAEDPASAETTVADRAFDPDELAVQLPAEYDAAIDHLRYEAADVVYHLMVVLERYGISLDEFAAELNTRMTDAERPKGAVYLRPEHVKRGK
ncbi:phosphoribosyl-ATP diphosphatase [Eggerthellaceae bacterium zg-893]|nr:phosphoribosyl-ATP diphosphatase [Eggerthellaceae bacterium zg-893]